MTPITALWIASIVGALLFFASGILVAPVLQRAFGVADSAAVVPSVYVADEPAASEQRLQAEVSRFEALAHGARQEVEALRRQLEQESQARAQLDTQLLEARTRTEQATRRWNDAREAAASVPALQKRVEELQKRVEELQKLQSTTQPIKELAADVVRQRQRALEQELAEAREQLAELRAQAEAAAQGQNLELEKQIKRLEEEKQQRGMRLEMLNMRVAELEVYAEENAALRNERDALRQDMQRLQREAQVAAPAATAPLQVAPAAVTTHGRASQSGTRRVHEDDTVETSLRRSLAGIAAREPGLIAVLSDDNGFPVAGVGSDHQQETVSVLTSLTQELAERVHEFVDLGRIERMELADGDGRALRVRFFDWEDHPLALGCLGRRSLVVNPDEEQIVATFPKLLRRAFSAGA